MTTCCETGRLVKNVVLLFYVFLLSACLGMPDLVKPVSDFEMTEINQSLLKRIFNFNGIYSMQVLMTCCKGHICAK